METPVTIEAPVTAELLQQKAEEVGRNLNTLKANYPKTSSVLLLDSTIVKDQTWNDPDALTAKSMAQDCEWDNAENSRRIGQNLFASESSWRNPQRVGEGLNKLAELTSQTDRAALLAQVEKQISETRFKLISSREMSGEEMRYLIDRRQVQYEAREELQGK